ncbi:MAG: LLM class flavin-dependent oxidoreductase [Actinomycetota bacterium]
MVSEMVRHVPIGVTLPQFTADPEVLISGARRAEALGLDSIWVFDHLWPLSGGRQRPVIEGWTALAWLAAATERIGIGTLVTRSSLRPAAVLAQMAGTVAAIAPGRLTVGLGSGDARSRAENEAFGIDYHPGERRATQLAATAEVLRAHWAPPAGSGETIAVIPAGPRPWPHPQLWIAGRSDAVMALAGRLADGWNGWASGPETFRADVARLERAACGRRVTPTWGGLVVLGDSDEHARYKLGSRDPSGYVVGGPDTVAAHLSALVRAGAHHLIVTFPDAARPGAFERLARAVRPRIEALVATT